MATLYTQQDSNVRKTWLLISVFLIIIIGLGFAFSYILNNQVILYIAVIFSLVMNGISFWYSDKIALKMSGATLADPGRYRDLHNLVENLALTAGLPKPRVYIINEAAPNAFATGRNKDKAAVAVTTGLLDRLDRTELEGVIAHELAHIGNRDILLSTLVVVLVGFVALLSDLFIRFTFFGGGRGGDRGGSAQVILLVVGIGLAILSPIVATIIQLAISRKREFLADATGALLTRYPEGLASALEKISGYSGEVKRASNATAHLYIASPFGAGGRRGFHKLFMTHPPVAERIAALRMK
ncbi:MAG: M48 family metalloprotease [Candidatus Paceibacterota bacterium]